MTTEATEKDALDTFVERANKQPATAVMLMLWQNRHANPEMTITITEKDIKGFTDCVEYLDVKPVIRITRPQGLPAQEAIPPMGNRRAVPGRVAQPPKPFAVIQMTDLDGNAIVPVENNEADQDAGRAMRAKARIRETAPELAKQLLASIGPGATINDELIREAAGALKALATA